MSHPLQPVIDELIRYRTDTGMDPDRIILTWDMFDEIAKKVAMFDGQRLLGAKVEVGSKFRAAASEIKDFEVVKR